MHFHYYVLLRVRTYFRIILWILWLTHWPACSAWSSTYIYIVYGSCGNLLTAYSILFVPLILFRFFLILADTYTIKPTGSLEFLYHLYFLTQEHVIIMEKLSSNFITIFHGLTNILGKKSDIDKGLYIAYLVLEKVYTDFDQNFAFWQSLIPKP